MEEKSSEYERSQDEMSLQLAKQEFMDLTRKALRAYVREMSPYAIYTKEMIAKIIRELKIRTTSRQYDCYEVKKKDGEEHLYFKKDSSVAFKRVLSLEEIFDTFMDLHVKRGHRGPLGLRKMVEQKYVYPEICLEFISKVCRVCNQPAYAPHKVSLVYVITVVQKRGDEQFRYLLIHVDEETNYALLRPLMLKKESEIALELFKIFTQFGPPKTLYFHGYNSQLTTNVDHYLQELCPMFKIIVEHRPVSFDFPTLVMDKLQEWMESTMSDFWELACSVVQTEMNNDFRMNPSHSKSLGTPNSLFFNCVKDKAFGELVSTLKQMRSYKFNLGPKNVDVNNEKQAVAMDQPPEISNEADIVEISIPSPDNCDILFAPLEALSEKNSQSREYDDTEVKKENTPDIKPEPMDVIEVDDSDDYNI